MHAILRGMIGPHTVRVTRSACMVTLRVLQSAHCILGLEIHHILWEIWVVLLRGSVSGRGSVADVREHVVERLARAGGCRGAGVVGL